jgi:hypothetical protein
LKWLRPEQRLVPRKNPPSATPGAVFESEAHRCRC